MISLITAASSGNSGLLLIEWVAFARWVFFGALVCRFEAVRTKLNDVDLTLHECGWCVA